MSDSIQHPWQARYERRRLQSKLGRVILWTLSIAFTLFLVKHVILALIA